MCNVDNDELAVCDEKKERLMKKKKTCKLGYDRVCHVSMISILENLNVCQAHAYDIWWIESTCAVFNTHFSRTHSVLIA